MHPVTMQLMAEVRAQEMLLKPRDTRSLRNEKSVAARLRRFFLDSTPAGTAA
ncbi:MAG: hypothetical protein ACRDHD_04700 [Candidatus Limnocylindria bacterium]